MLADYHNLMRKQNWKPVENENEKKILNVSHNTLNKKERTIKYALYGQFSRLILVKTKNIQT